MTQIIYDDRLYNEEIKRQYIAEKKGKTRNNLERIFKVSSLSEFELDKDLFDFTREELRNLFYTFMATTPAASRANVQQVQTYIDWAVEMDYTNFNAIDSIDRSWKEQFVVRAKKSFWTDKEVKSMLKKIVSAQVAVVFYAPFVGIKGHNNSEIVGLKGNDINEETLEVKLIDEKSNGERSARKIKVDEEFVRICRQAINEDEYVKSNGSPDPEMRSSEVANLIRNEFVVRAVETRVINYQQADGMTVYRRFETLSKYFNEENLHPTNMMYSGMLAMAKNLHLEGKLDEEGYKKIAEQFNLNPGALKRCRDDFLNEKTLKEIYELA